MTSRIRKPSSVFDKFGLDWKYRGEQRFSTQSGKKMQCHSGCPNQITAAIAMLNQAEEKGDCKKT